MTQQNDPNLIGNLSVADVGRMCYAIDTALNPVDATVAAGGTAPAGLGLFDQLPTDRRDIILAGVNDVLTNPTITPEQLHSNWIARRKAQGWTRGGTTHVGRKEHARLVPYGELPIRDQVHARVFIAIVRSVMAPVGQGQGQAQQQKTALRTE
jgi:hypothetical protein